MLPFFRKIRWRLAANNQFFKYSRYAIGEIVLVVIGILIALYINNWNEKRKEREKFDKALIEVEKELISNIKLCRRSMQDYVGIDSLVNRVLHDKLSLDDYRKDSLLSLSAFLRTYPGFNVRNQEFSKLQEISGEFEGERDTIKNHLIEVYVDAVWGVEAYDDRMMELNNDILASYKDKDWYIDWLGFRSMNEGMVDFFLNDVNHRNNVALYAKEGLKTHHGFMDAFEKKARKSYFEIHKYLYSNGLKHSDSILFTSNVEDFDHYVGTYETEWYSFPMIGMSRDSVEIKIINSNLIYSAFYPNGEISELEILPMSKFHFRYKDENISGFHRLIFNEYNEVIGLEYSQGGDLIKHVKIR